MTDSAESVASLIAKVRSGNDEISEATLENLFQELKLQITNLQHTDAAQLEQVDLTSEQSVRVFVTNLKRQNNHKVAMDKLSAVVRTAIYTGKINKLNLHHPTVAQEMQYWREIDDVKENVGEGMRALEQIPIFTGDGVVSWISFEHPWMVAIKNKNLSETTLRTALVSKLQGAAGIYYLSLDRVERLGFAEVMEKLRERYTRDSTSAVNVVSNMFQKQNERVLDFSARILLAGRGMLPVAPKELSVMKFPSSEYTFPNPLFIDQEKSYDLQHKLSLTHITKYFLSGLRGDIKDRITSNKYTSYTESVDAAEKAEWMKDSVIVAKVHHLQQADDDEDEEDESAAEANVLKGQRRSTGKKMQLTKFKSQTSPYKKGNFVHSTKKDIRKATKEDQCFNCQKYGHFSKDCFQKKKGKSNIRMKVNQTDFRVFQQMKRRGQMGKVHLTQADEYYDPEEDKENEQPMDDDTEDTYEIEIYE
jgi:hypothetical protein